MTPGSRSLLVAGEAGIGKTTIWQEVVRIAGSDSRVLTSRASEIEVKLSFAVLTDLFGGQSRIEAVLHRDEQTSLADIDRQPDEVARLPRATSSGVPHWGSRTLLPFIRCGKVPVAP